MAEATSGDIDLSKVTSLITNKLYGNGYFTILMFFIIEQSIMYTGVFIAFSGTFTTGNMDYCCNIPQNHTSLHAITNQCYIMNTMSNETEKCVFGYKFISDPNFVKSSIKADFELICDRKYFDGATQSCIMGGFFFGGIVGSLLGDKYGRRFVVFIGFFLLGIIGMLIVIIKNIYLLMFANFILGTLREVIMTAGFVYGLEFIPNYKQSLYGMFTQLLWAFNISLLGAMAYFLRSWKHLQIFGSFLIFLCSFFFFMVPESPRWLIVEGEFVKLQEMVNKFANRINTTKYDVSETVHFKNNSSSVQNQMDSQKCKAQYSPLDICRTKILFIWSIILILGWIFIVFSYYTVTMKSVTFDGNKYLIFILTSMVEIPCILLCFIFIQKGRNITLFFLTFVFGISSITIGFLRNDFTITILILSMIGKGCLAGTFFIIVVTSVYIYPTSIRSFGTGIPSAIGKLFSIMFPYFTRFTSIYSWLPTLIIGIFSCFIGIINVFYPDWINKPLPETLEDLQLLKNGTGLQFKSTKNKNNRIELFDGETF